LQLKSNLKKYFGVSITPPHNLWSNKLYKTTLGEGGGECWSQMLQWSKYPLKNGVGVIAILKIFCG